MTKPDTPNTQSARTVTCPTCNGDSIYGHINPHRPFCCERCRSIDLGNWANEDFRMQLEPEASLDLIDLGSIE